jgi:hypothetical protein
VSTRTVPPALRVTYLILGWVTAVADAVFVIALAAARPTHTVVVKPSDADKAAGLFVFAVIIAMGMLAAHLIEQAGGPE